MDVLRIAGLLVVAAVVVAIVVAAHRSRSGSAHVSEPPLGGTAFGAVPGYMPGMSPRVEQRTVAVPARIDPPHTARGAAAVDLDGNVALLRTRE